MGAGEINNRSGVFQMASGVVDIAMMVIWSMELCQPMVNRRGIVFHVIRSHIAERHLHAFRLDFPPGFPYYRSIWSHAARVSEAVAHLLRFRFRSRCRPVKRASSAWERFNAATRSIQFMFSIAVFGVEPAYQRQRVVRSRWSDFRDHPRQELQHRGVLRSAVGEKYTADLQRTRI